MAPLDETKDLVRKIEPIRPGLARRLWYLNLLSDKSRTSKENLTLLRLLADREARISYQDDIRLPPPLPEALLGEFYVGDVLYPISNYSPFGLREEDFVKHVLIVGMTGSGKTNLCFQILRELARKNIPFLVLDWKGTYRALKSLPEFDSLKIIRIAQADSTFKFNPLIPPSGVNPKHWMAQLIDVMKHSFFISYGPEYWLRKGIDELYGRWKIYEGQQIYPTFADLEQLLRREFVRGREMLWMSSAKRVLAVLTFSGLLGELLNVRQQPDFDRLFEGQVILELDNLAEVEKTFLVEALLLYLYQQRKAQGKTKRLRNVLVMEEAHHVLSRRKEFMSGEETIMESVVRMIREFGVGIIAIDQEPSKVSRSVMANTNCKMCLRLGNGRDIGEMGLAMGLGIGERGWLEKLSVGHGVLKLSDRFSDNVHVKFPLVEVG